MHRRSQAALMERQSAVWSRARRCGPPFVRRTSSVSAARRSVALPSWV